MSDHGTYPRVEDIPKLALTPLNEWETGAWENITGRIRQRQPLSARQINLWWKLRDKLIQPATPIRESQTILKGLIDFLNRCPNQRPTLHLFTITIKKNSGYSRYPESYAVTQDKYGEQDYLGSITGDGKWLPGKKLARQDEIVLVAKLRLLSANPEATIKEELIRESAMHCCFCARELSDERSQAVGYGPDCAEHYNLPYPSKEDLENEKQQKINNEWADLADK